MAHAHTNRLAREKSPYLLQHQFNPVDWYAWGEMRKAKPIPGAVDFLNYADSKGVRVFFVSNRDKIQEQATIDNLKSAGFAQLPGLARAAARRVHQRYTERGRLSID